MTNPKYMTIKQARENPKGTSLIIKVVSLGELSTGVSSTGEEWKKQKAVLRDKSDVQELILWNNDIGRLEQGKFYKLITPYWNEYKDKLQLTLGKYCIIQECTEADLLPAIVSTVPTGTTVLSGTTPSTGTTVLTVSSYDGFTGDMEKRNETIPSKTIPAKTDDILETARKITGNKSERIVERLDFIWAVEIITRDYLMTSESKIPDNARVGMYMKLILDEME